MSAEAVDQLRAAMELFVSDRIDESDVAAHLGVDPNAPRLTQRIGSVAVIPVVGFMQPKSDRFLRFFGGTSTEQVVDEMTQAVGDQNTSAVVGYFDTGGGTAIGNEEAAAAIRSMRGSKPLIAFVKGTCASAGYYLASAFDRVVATASSRIGSIGTMYEHFDQSEFWSELGVKFDMVVNQHSPRKADFSSNVPLSAEARDTLQKMVDDFGDQFLNTVARNRGVTREQVNDRFGKGRVFLAAEAQQAGMIDGIAESLQAVIANIKSSKGAVSLAPSWDVAAEDQYRHGALGASFGCESTALPSSSQIVVGPVAGCSPAETVAETSATIITESDTMKRVKAWLFSRGLIAENADDANVQTALRSYFAALGQSLPEGEENILAVLNGQSRPSASAAAAVSTPSSSSSSDAAVQAASDRERAELLQAERERIADIRSAAALLNETHAGVITDAAIETAINSGQSRSEASDAFLQIVRTANVQRPVTRVTVGDDGASQYCATAQAAVLCGLRSTVLGDDGHPRSFTAEEQRLSRAPLHVHAKRFLEMNAVHFDPYCSDEEIVELAMRQNGAERAKFYSSMEVGMAAPINRPGDFPNLLGGVGNALIDEGMRLANTTYQEWTGMLPQQNHFNPTPIVATGGVGELSEMVDGKQTPEGKLAEELLSFLLLRQFGQKIGLTPKMVVGNGVNAWRERMFNLGRAWQNTINRLCVNVLVSNSPLLDGTALFHASHGNLVSSGAAPSSASANAMDLLFAAQKDVGSHNYLREQMRIALVPDKHKQAARQTFLDFSQLRETKAPASDATVNTHRGEVTPIVEPELKDFDVDAWYGLADPRVAPLISVAYFAGFARNGMREQWYDPDSKTTYTSLEGRVGVAVSNYRNGVKNPGT